MKDEILNLNLNEQGSVVDCPSAFEEVGGQVKAAALSLPKVFKVFPRRWSLSKPGESQVGGHSPGQGQTLLGTRSKVTEQMSMRFFQKLTDQQISNICTKKQIVEHCMYSKYYSIPMIDCVHYLYASVHCVYTPSLLYKITVMKFVCLVLQEKETKAHQKKKFENIPT